MDVLRDTAILDLRRNNITVLEEQLRQTRDRFNVGEVTRTDVAQAESSLATARSDYFTAQAILQDSIATFRRIIGVEPTRLEPARTIEALLPKNLNFAVALALEQHPAVQAALHAVDAAALQVKLVEGELYPTLNIVGNVQHQTDYLGVRNATLLNGSVSGVLSVPIYTGGEVDARARQAKETLAQARLQADLERDVVRAAVVSAWGQLDCRAGGDPVGAGGGQVGGDRARRHKGGGQGRPAHHLRHSVPAAGPAQHQGQPGHRRARPGGRLLRGDGGDRAAVGGQPRPQCRYL